MPRTFKLKDEFQKPISNYNGWQTWHYIKSTKQQDPGMLYFRARKEMILDDLLCFCINKQTQTNDDGGICLQIDNDEGLWV